MQVLLSRQSNRYAPIPLHPTGDSHLRQIIERRELTALFQPIIALRDGTITGYEGLIRGPSDSPLHSPANLFRAAREAGLEVEVEHLCRRVVLESFTRLDLPGRLFLNVSPACLMRRNARHGETLGYIRDLGIAPNRIIIELTENQPAYDYNLLREATRHYREMGFQIAIDDLGEGFSSLRLWSELRPEYVKIDMHFIQGINRDPVKRQFVRSIQQIAQNSGCQAIAEGIETQAELLLVRELGIGFGQGYYLGRPNALPALALTTEVEDLLTRQSPCGTDDALTATKLARAAPWVSPTTSNERIYVMFAADPELQAVPVVDQGRPIGLISRFNLIDRFARPYHRELFGKEPCTYMMDPAPLVVDQGISLQDLSDLIVAGDRQHLSNGFIITANGQYLGMGSGHDLVREITQMQITAARYANPLTLLPGNVPINRHIDGLLHARVSFWACYCDLDHFKPYNDIYGYCRGDDLIQLTGRILSDACDASCDFIGHIGGDDFIILFQSTDWEARCQAALERFEESVALLSTKEEDRQRGGYETEDRQGNRVFHPLVSLSLGVAPIEPDLYKTHHEIADVATAAKKQAKKIPGNSLFVERREISTSTDDVPSSILAQRVRIDSTPPVFF